MRQTDKMFMRLEKFGKHAFLWYINPEWRVKVGEAEQDRFTLSEEDTRQFLRADLDSWHYFQNKLTESMNEYHIVLKGFMELLDVEHFDGGWDEDASSVARDYCWDMEGHWHNVECYQMILGELKKKHEVDGLA